jgi:hypothetical protein
MPQFGVTCHMAQAVPAAASPPRCRGFFSGVVINGESPADVKAECRLAKTRERVGQLLATGECDEAVKAALATGSLAYARQVRDFCAPPTPASSEPAQQ